jgi:hypothetical protein
MHELKTLNEWNTSTEVGDHKMLKSQTLRLYSMCIFFLISILQVSCNKLPAKAMAEGLSLGMWHCAVGWAVPYTVKALQLHDTASNARLLESSTPLWEMNKSERYSNYVHTNTKCTFILFKPTHALFSKHINIHI